MVGMGYVVVSTLSFHIRLEIITPDATDFFSFLFFSVKQITCGIGHCVK